VESNQIQEIIDLMDAQDIPTGIVYAYLNKRGAETLGYTEEDYEEIGNGIVKITVHNPRRR